MTEFKRVENTKEFLSRTGLKKVRDHSFNWKICHWHACIYCGLLPLKNENTRTAMKRKCVSYEDE